MNNDINIVIGFLTEDLWPDVKRIYESGIKTKNATFETSAPEWDSWNRAHRSDCRLAASVNNRVVGWAALSGVSGRCVYSGVAEVSIYVDPGFTGKGVGSILMEELIRESETKGIWTLQAGIFPENVASLKLHGKHGFRTVGIRERLGKLDNKWRDVVLMERRSSIAGID